MFVRTSVRFSVEIAASLKSVKICKIDRSDKAELGPLVMGPGHYMRWTDHGDSGAVNICNITKHISSDYQTTVNQTGTTWFADFYP